MQGNLVTDLISDLYNGLTTLQRMGFRTRQWHRMRTDEKYAAALIKAAADLDRQLAGDTVKLKAGPGETREVLLAKIKEVRQFVHVLVPKIIAALSTSGTTPDIDQVQEYSHWDVELVLFKIGYSMRFMEALDEHEARGLQPANTMDALRFALQGKFPYEGKSLCVLGSRIQRHGDLGVEVLSLGRVMAGDPTMGLHSESIGFPGGTWFLAKRKV